MRRLITAAALAAGLAFVPAPAWADHEWGGGGYEEGCGRGGAGCGNERHEDYEGANCKYVCPQFDRSPVQDAFNFNPQVCLPGATCHFEDRERQDRPPAEEGQQPAS